jgi:hypothetical protein
MSNKKLKRRNSWNSNSRTAKPMIEEEIEITNTKIIIITGITMIIAKVIVNMNSSNKETIKEAATITREIIKEVMKVEEVTVTTKTENTMTTLTIRIDKLLTTIQDSMIIEAVTLIIIKTIMIIITKETMAITITEVEIEKIINTITKVIREIITAGIIIIATTTILKYSNSNSHIIIINKIIKANRVITEVATPKREVITLKIITHSNTMRKIRIVKMNILFNLRASLNSARALIPLKMITEELLILPRNLSLYLKFNPSIARTLLLILLLLEL